MRIVSVAAHSFRGLRSKTLTLGDGLNVVYGPNGSGKTTWHAAMYAALCGQPPHAGKAPRLVHADGTPYSVDAVVALDRRREVHIHQDLVNPESSTVRDRAGQHSSAGGGAQSPDGLADLRYDGGVDITRHVGLDWRTFAATAWVEQRRGDWFDREGRSELQRAVALCVGEDAARIACEDMAAARRHYVGGDVGPLRRAIAELARRQADVAVAERLQNRRDKAAEALDRCRRESEHQQRRLSTARATAARAEAARLREEADRLRLQVEGPADAVVKTYSTWSGDTVNSRNDVEVHHSVIEAETALSEAEAALRQAETTPTPIQAPGWRVVAATPPPADDPSDPDDPLGSRPVFIGGLTSIAVAALGFILWPLIGPAGLVFGILGVVGALVAVALLRPLRRRRGSTNQLAGAATANRRVVVDTMEKLPPPPPVMDHAAAPRRRYEQERQRLVEALTRRGYATTAGNVHADLERYRADTADRARRDAESLARRQDDRARLAVLDSQLALADRRAAELVDSADPYGLNPLRNTFSDGARAGYAVATVSVTEEAERAAREVKEAEGAATEADRAAAGAERVARDADEEAARFISVEEARAAAGRADSHVERLRVLDRTLATAHDRLSLARESALEEIAAGIRVHLSLFMSEITADPDLRVDVDRQLRVLVGELGQDLDEPAFVSHSTAEQSHLLTRIALSRYLTGGRPRTPLLLDDVTSNADGRRVRRVLDLLYRIGQQCQVVVFAHEDAALQWADENRMDDPRLHLHLLSNVNEAPATVSDHPDHLGAGLD